MARQAAIANGEQRPRTWRSAARFLTGPRLLPVWLLAGAAWAMFACFRAGLLIARRNVLADSTAADIARCFLTGLRFDAVPIGYAMIPLVLALLLTPAEPFRRKWFQRGVVAYAAALTTVGLLVEVVGAGFFLRFGARLNWTSIDYFNHFGELAIYLWRAYPLWLLAIAMVAIPVLSAWFYRRLFRRPLRRAPAWLRGVLAASLLLLCVLAARGGLEPHPIRPGTAYFSENNILNQLAMNNFYTLTHAAILKLEDSEQDGDLYALPPPKDAAALTRQMLLQPQDTPLDVPTNPLWRRTAAGGETRDFNVVLIIMEGMSGQPVGALGHSPSQTPEFDRLCEQGMFFERMYAVGPLTSWGIVGVLCGYPDLIGQSIMKRDRSQGAFLTLPGVFRRRGYRTLFIYGGDPEFDNMRGFFSAGGVERFIGQDDMLADREPGNWGMPDEVIFREAHRAFEEIDRRGDRFFAVILTVSNHEPYDVPPNRTAMLPEDTDENRKLNAYRYADWAMGQFFQTARASDYFDRTLFVMVADHGRDLDRKRVIDVPGYRVPCLFYAPALLPPRRVGTVASQTDIAPTLLARLGGSYEHCFFGRDAASVPAGEGFALLHEADRMAFVAGGTAMILPPRGTSILFYVESGTMEPVSPDAMDRAARKRMERNMLSIYQTARQLYLARTYRDPAADPPAME